MQEGSTGLLKVRMGYGLRDMGGGEVGILDLYAPGRGESKIC